MTILAQAYEKHGDKMNRTFIHATFSELVAQGEGMPKPENYDAVLLLDVLYHIPDAELHWQLLDFAFRARKAVLLTFSPVKQEFGGTRIGQPGFAWFPRPEVRRYIDEKVLDDGWKIVFDTSDFRAGPQQQRLVALVRQGRPGIVGDES